MQEDIIRYLQSWSNPVLDFFFTFVSMLGEPYSIILLVCWVYWNVSKKHGFLLGFVFVVSLGINAVAKIIVHSSRPFEVLNDIRVLRVETATGSSFPSGHTQGIATLTFTLWAWLRKRFMLIIAFVLVLLMALSRMYLGCHWLVDVVGGAVMGVVLAVILFRWFDKIYDNTPLVNRLIFGITIAWWLIFAVLFVLKTTLYEWLYINDFMKITALTTGLTAGFFIENKTIRYIVENTMLFKIIRYVVGIVITIALLAGLKVLLPHHYGFDIVRYTVLGFWISYGCPALCSRFRLFNTQTA